MKKKLVIVDDHPVTLAGIKAIVEMNEELFVVDVAINGEEAIEKILKNRPDLVLMDINMPNLSGIEATKKIIQQIPDMKIIALSMHGDQHFVKRMLNAGAVGYLLKEEAPEELLKAIQKTLNGEMYLSSGVTRAALEKQNQFDDIFVLQTKLARPPLLPGYISREILTEKLEKNVIKPLSLITAGAGFGKSITTSEWVERSELKHSWLSLDKEHNELRAFLTYFCAAIEKTFPNSFPKTKRLFKTHELASNSILHGNLVNEICEIDEDFIVVLDDYHVIRERKIHDFINLWLKFPPPNVHLCITSRRDPPIDINYLQTTDRVTTLRMNDLCFSKVEILELFKKKLGLNLSEERLNLLEQISEGWPMGLKMISVLVKDHKGIDFILNTIPKKSTILSEYLMIEVLTKQSQIVQDQIVNASVLNRFCIDLLQEITPDNYSSEQKITGVNWLNLTNIFVVALDDEKKWFRFHHLFQKVLNLRLKELKKIEEIKQIHLKSSLWFEKKGLINEAIEHAILTGDIERGINIILSNWIEAVNEDQWLVIQQWLNYIPKSSLDSAYKLLLVRMWIAHKSHRLQEIVELVGSLEKFKIKLNEEDKGYFLFGKMVVSYLKGDGLSAISFAEQALKIIPNTSYYLRADIHGWWTVAMQITGQGEKAIKEIKKDLLIIEDRKEYIPLARRTVHQNYVYIYNCDLDAITKNLKSFFKIPKIGNYVLGWGWYFNSMVSWWSNDPENTVKNIKPIIDYRFDLRPRLVIDAFVCYALALEKLKRSDKANKIIDDGLEFAFETNNKTNIEVIQSGKARLNLLQNRRVASEEWRSNTATSCLDTSTLWWIEVPAITYCRVLIASNEEEKLKEALSLLIESQVFSESTFNLMRSIEVILLQVQIKIKLEKMDEATILLKKALELTGTRNWVMPFVEVGKEIEAPLTVLHDQGFKSKLIKVILGHFKHLEKIKLNELEVDIIEVKANLAILTRREVEVLECIAVGLRNQEIANKIFRSPETVKKHIYNMFQKLQVRNRMSLVARAKEMGIIES